ncbi:MAG: L-ribulose-5-phosphate 4-epimerase AraD [Lachnospirales bacterium]
MYNQLKRRVFDANIELANSGLVVGTWGNVSEIDRNLNVVGIKPSGVSYSNMKESDIVVIDLEGNVVDGSLKPSSDTATHLEIYKNFDEVGGITHTHSTTATGFAQAGVNAQALGTTHHDYFYGDVPVTRQMTQEEIETDYELNTGKVIVETFVKNNINPMYVPAVLVNQHGPFTWGKSAKDSVFHGIVLEEVCKMNLTAVSLNSEILMNKHLQKKHFLRKHGENSYYGQK